MELLCRSSVQSFTTKMDTFFLVFILQAFLSTSTGSLLPCTGERCRDDVIEFPSTKPELKIIYTLKKGRFHESDEIPGIVSSPVQSEFENSQNETGEAPSYFDFAENLNMTEVLSNPEPKVVQIFGNENLSEERHKNKDISRFYTTDRKPEAIESLYRPLGPLVLRYNSSRDQSAAKGVYSSYRFYTSNRGLYALSTVSLPTTKTHHETTDRFTTTKRHYGTTDSHFTATKRHYRTTDNPITTTKRRYGTTENPFTTTKRHYWTADNPFTTTIRQYGTTVNPFTTTKRHYWTADNPFTTTKRQYGTTEIPFTTTESHYGITGHFCPTTKRHYGTTEYHNIPNKDASTKRSFSTLWGPNNAKERPFITTKGFHTTTRRPYSYSSGPHNFFMGSYKLTSKPLVERYDVFGMSYDGDKQQKLVNVLLRASSYGYEKTTSKPGWTNGFLRESARPLDTLDRSTDSDSFPALMMAGDLNALLYMTQFNLSGFNLTGDMVKFSLHRLNTSEPLRRLLLSHNRISALPREIFPLQLEYSLQELSLDNNPLVSLSKQSCFELSRLKSLRVLSLSGSRLQYIEGIFHMPGLEVLDLSDNFLTMVPPSLNSLSKLRLLDLSGNDMVWLDSYPLYTLQTLRVLNLAGNGMKFIREDPFSTLDQLESLYLNNNSLEYVTGLQTISESAWVYLSRNPWRCQCDLASVVFSEWPYIADKNLITCVVNDKESTPQLLSSLTEEEFSDLCPRGRGWLRRRVAVLWTKIRCRAAALWGWIRQEVEVLRRYVITDNLFTLLQILFLLYFLVQVYNVLLVVRNVRREESQEGDSRYVKVADSESSNCFSHRRHSC